MPRVAPFVGLRYDPAVAGPIAQLTAPPYDVISEPHRDGFHGASPYNVAHLDLAAVKIWVIQPSTGLLELQGTAEGQPFDRAQLDRLLELGAAGMQRIEAEQLKAVAVQR
jgi:hypothetical protein